MILDGWDLAPSHQVTLLPLADTPVMDQLWNTYPQSTLLTSERCGIPVGQMGNSEVGHRTLGRQGNFQDLARINKDIREGK